MERVQRAPIWLLEGFDSSWKARLVQSCSEVSVHQLLEIEQRPDQQAGVLSSSKMVVYKVLDHFVIEQIVDLRARVYHSALYIFNAFALEPAGIRRRETLLLPACDVGRDMPLHHRTKRQLAVPRALVITLGLAARLVLV